MRLTRFFVLLGLVTVLLAACSSTVGPNAAAPAEAVDQPEPEAEPAIVEPRLVAHPVDSDPFDAIGTSGTFVARQVGSTTVHVIGEDRASIPYLPASTFKILNSLIILETDQVGSVDDVVEWDGEYRGIDAWNQDHSLRSGIEVSAVWLYQHHARGVGEERMAELVSAADYGNGILGGPVDRFWLDGALRISALEQLDVMERLMTDALPFDVDHQEAVREILVREEGDSWRWLHKTGTAIATEPVLGWLVGAAEHESEQWVFALNLDLEELGPDGVVTQINPQARIDIARTLLADLGALPAS